MAQAEMALGLISERVSRPDVVGRSLHARPVHVRLVRDISSQRSPGLRLSNHHRQELARQLMGLPLDKRLSTLPEAHNAAHIIKAQHVDHLTDVLLLASIGSH